MALIRFYSKNYLKERYRTRPIEVDTVGKDGKGLGLVNENKHIK